MANEFKVKNGLLVSGSANVNSSGSFILSVDGYNGRLLQVDDGIQSGSVYSVNTISGLPIIEAFSDSTIRIGKFGQKALYISQSKVGIGKEGPLNGVLDISGNVHITGSLFATASYATLSGTDQTGILKGDGTNITTAVVNSDYQRTIGAGANIGISYDGLLDADIVYTTALVPVVTYLTSSNSPYNMDDDVPIGSSFDRSSLNNRIYSCNTNSGSIILNLPTFNISGVYPTKLNIIVKKTDSTSNTVVLQPDTGSGDTINGQNSYTLLNNSSVILYRDQNRDVSPVDWQTLGPNLDKETPRTIDADGQVITSTTLVDVNGLAKQNLIPGRYVVDAWIFGQSSSTAGAQFAISASGTVTEYQLVQTGQTSTTAMGATALVTTNNTTSTTFMTTANAECWIHIFGQVKISTISNITTKALKVTSGNLTIRSGSFMTTTRVAN